MVAHETTEESNENREYSRERVANSKTRLKKFFANSRNHEWQTRERRGLPVHHILGSFLRFEYYVTKPL